MGVGTAAAVSAGAALIGTGMSVYGSMQQAGAQKDAANYQAQVAKNNAIVASQNATAVQHQAEARAQADQRAGAMRLGAQRAALGASGVTLDSGSGLALQGDTAANTALGVENALYEGQLKAFGYRTQGDNFTAQAGLDTMRGQAASDAGFTNAAASFLSGASQVSSKWAAYQQTTTKGNTPGIKTGLD